MSASSPIVITLGVSERSMSQGGDVYCMAFLPL